MSQQDAFDNSPFHLLSAHQNASPGLRDILTDIMNDDNLELPTISEIVQGIYNPSTQNPAVPPSTLVMNTPNPPPPFLNPAPAVPNTLFLNTPPLNTPTPVPPTPVTQNPRRRLLYPSHQNPPGRQRRFSYTPTVPKPNFQVIFEAGTLDKYLDVFGNCYKGVYFIALRFKLPVATYHQRAGSSPIHVPDNTAVVIHGNTFPKMVEGTKGLFFKVSNRASSSEQMLLKSMFPDQSNLLSCFHRQTLFVVSNKNPFSTWWTKCRRNVAFNALYQFYEIYIGQKSMQLEDIGLLRLFQRNCYDPTHFNTWYQLATALVSKEVNRILARLPSAQLGLTVHQVLRRLQTHVLPSNHPPPDFYAQCEIMYTDTEPLGVLYRTENRKVIYVSPMVVSYQPYEYRDSNSVFCNCWLPLLQDLNHFKKHVVEWYLKHSTDLPYVIAWLSMQTAEKYRFLQTDLEQVNYLMFDCTPKSRWPSKPLFEL